jgi:hypothetical protein
MASGEKRIFPKKNTENGKRKINVMKNVMKIEFK